jgi:Superinfection immunity protein
VVSAAPNAKRGCAVLTLVFMIVLYFLPAIIGRDKRDAAGIFLLNLFLGWTVIGWVIALIWACAAEPYVPVRLVPVQVAGRFCCQCGSLTCPGAHFCTCCGRTV